MSADTFSTTGTLFHADQSTVAWFDMLPAQLAIHLRKLADEIEAQGPAHSADLVPNLNNWALARRAVPCLIGVPSGHPKIGDGKTLMSSELFFMDLERGLARSFSRWYRLGSRAKPGYWNERLTTP
jgi:hypothetical protein